MRTYTFTIAPVLAAALFAGPIPAQESPPALRDARAALNTDTTAHRGPDQAADRVDPSSSGEGWTLGKIEPELEALSRTQDELSAQQGTFRFP